MDTNLSGTWQNRMLGRYRLIHLLGRGGMGEVWLAEDTQLRRQVAVKLLPSVLASDSSFRQAFEREARAAAALEHPHILPVHDFGEQQIAEDEIVTFLITPYISGGTLRDRLLSSNGPLPAREAMDYLRQAAEAIDFAHSQHVLHRDIKPANMLLQQDWLFLTDFGIAKLLTNATQLGRTQAGAGTPEYMAPEQVRGKAEPASDRYSFAVTAYHVFTGQVPFRGETPYSTLIKQITEAPPPPRQFNPALPPTVEQAILQGLAKQPEARPASCMALVSALERGWQMSMPPRFNPAAATEAGSQGWQTSFPSQLPSTVPTGVALPQQVPVSHPSISYASLSMAGPVTDKPAELPVSPTSRGSKITRRTLLVGGTAAIVAIGGTAALYTLFRSRSSPTSLSPKPQPKARPPQPGPKKLQVGVPLLSLTGHMKDVSVAKWDPSGRYLATAGEDTYVMLWDIASYVQSGSTALQTVAKPLHSWKLASPILANGLCWSADGRTLAVVTGESKIFLYNPFNSADTPQVYEDANTADSPTAPAHIAIAWSPTANTFATPSYVPQQTQQQVVLWQLHQTTRPLRTLSSDTSGSARTLIIDDLHPLNSSATVDMVSWSPDGALVAGHTNFGLVTLWQAATGTIEQVLHLPLRPTQEHPAYILDESLVWSPVSSHLLAVSDIDVVTLWDVQQNKLLLTLKADDPVSSMTGLSWSSNGKYLAGSYAGSPRVYVWDVEMAGSGGAESKAQSPKLFFPQKGSQVHTATITDVSWSPDGRYMATASGDATVVVWLVDAAG